MTAMCGNGLLWVGVSGVGVWVGAVRVHECLRVHVCVCVGGGVVHLAHRDHGLDPDGPFGRVDGQHVTQLNLRQRFGQSLVAKEHEANALGWSSLP